VQTDGAARRYPSPALRADTGVGGADALNAPRSTSGRVQRRPATFETTTARRHESRGRQFITPPVEELAGCRAECRPIGVWRIDRAVAVGAKLRRKSDEYMSVSPVAACVAPAPASRHCGSVSRWLARSRMLLAQLDRRPSTFAFEVELTPAPRRLAKFPRRRDARDPRLLRKEISDDADAQHGGKASRHASTTSLRSTRPMILCLQRRECLSYGSTIRAMSGTLAKSEIDIAGDVITSRNAHHS
jgi:hypothetical protein